MAKLKEKYPYENFYSTSVLRHRDPNMRDTIPFPPLPDLWGIKRGTDFLFIYAAPSAIKRELKRPDDWEITLAGPGIWIGRAYKNLTGYFASSYSSDDLMKRYIDADGDEVEDAVDILQSLGIKPESNPESQLDRLGHVYR